jgi:hypothetical protein
MADTLERRTAAAISEQALAIVFGGSTVATLREDSPLGAVGLQPDDLISLSDAVATAAVERGLQCVLDDAAFEGVGTVGELVTAVQGRIAAGMEP